jgi:membrane protein
MIKTNLKNIYTITKTAFKKWWSKDPFRESAVIAYYSIFSLPGLLVVITTLAGYFFGRDVANVEVTNQISSMLGADTADQIKIMIEKASENSNSFWATIVGVVTITVGATGVFAQFQKSLNNIWEVKIDETKSGIWNIIKVRLFSFGIIVSVAFILLVSLVISATLSAFGNWLSGHFTDTFAVVLQVLSSILSLFILAVLFALMFKIFPDAKIKWKHVWIGSLATAFLFEIGKFCLGLYFGKLKPGTGYGAAESIILILLWVSYSSMIVFYGAECTHAFANFHSDKVPPTEIAQKP